MPVGAFNSASCCWPSVSGKALQTGTSDHGELARRIHSRYLVVARVGDIEIARRVIRHALR